MTDASTAIRIQKPSAPPTSHTLRAPLGMPKMVRIILDENEHIPPNGQFFGINGKGYLLKPGLEANVPEGICEILDHATELVPIVDPDTVRIVGWKNKRRYGYTRL